MNLHSCTQTPSTPSFLFYSYSIEVKWENGRGAWGGQMHPNLSAAVIELRLLAILAGIMLYFLILPPIAPSVMVWMGRRQWSEKWIKRKFWIGANCAF